MSLFDTYALYPVTDAEAKKLARAQKKRIEGGKRGDLRKIGYLDHRGEPTATGRLALERHPIDVEEIPGPCRCCGLEPWEHDEELKCRPGHGMRKDRRRYTIPYFPRGNMGGGPWHPHYVDRERFVKELRMWRHPVPDFIHEIYEREEQDLYGVAYQRVEDTMQYWVVRWVETTYDTSLRDRLNELRESIPDLERLQGQVHIGHASPTPRYRWRPDRYISGVPVRISTTKDTRGQEVWNPRAEVNFLTMRLHWNTFTFDAQRDDWCAKAWERHDLDLPPSPEGLSMWEAVEPLASRPGYGSE